MGRIKKFSLVSVLLLLGGVTLAAEEGMFLPNRLPVEILRGRYSFNITPYWRRLIQQASVRFPNGSGSFVSSKGLVFTNHHIGLDCAEKLSSEEANIVEDGFYAATRAEEKKCPDLELNILETIEDVTEKVTASVTSQMSTEEANLARRATINTLENEESSRTGLKCEMVTLWHGAQYNLYCYERYTDVRLVFMPELGIARFGGDPDNFEFPRYVLDVAFFRAYEDEEPVEPGAFFRWRRSAVREDELVFVTGHPGRTERLETVATVQFLRDTAYPQLLNILRRFEIALQQFSTEGPEEARIADKELFSIQNSRKAYTGFLQKLQDPLFMRAKEEAEENLQERLEARRELYTRYGSAWDDIASAELDRSLNYTEWRMLERGNGFYSKLFNMARTLVRLTTEREKPNAERLQGYTDRSIPRLEQVLFSTAPIYESLEVATLSDSLALLVETLGADDDLVQQLLAGKSPREQAYELVRGTRLKDVAYRKELAQGGIGAVRASRDPMIELALAVDPIARNLGKIVEEADELKRQGSTKLFQAIRELDGTTGYPDATFTLRVTYGTVKGYREVGRRIPIATNFEGLYRRAAEHGNLRPWKLPARWLERKEQWNLNTPFNFVSTNDITGGNSGSPVISRQGEVVGIIFDSNIQGLGNEFAFSDVQARAVSVSAPAVVEALQKIYDAGTLAEELGN